MTLMKSFLLGSAATFVVVAGAQAADLPTKKGAPAAEYVRVCKIGDIAGFVIPGTDTCLKIGGLICIAVGAGMMFFIGQMHTTDPDAPVFLGLIPAFVGVALLIYVFFMAGPVE